MILELPKLRIIFSTNALDLNYAQEWLVAYCGVSVFRFYGYLKSWSGVARGGKSPDGAVWDTLFIVPPYLKQPPHNLKFYPQKQKKCSFHQSSINVYKFFLCTYRNLTTSGLTRNDKVFYYSASFYMRLGLIFLGLG